MRDGIHLAEDSRDEVLKHIRYLWGYDVSLVGIDAVSGETRYAAPAADPEMSG